MDVSLQASRHFASATGLVDRDLRLKSIGIALIGAFLVGWFLFVPVGTDTVSTIANILVPLVPVWWCLIPGRSFRGAQRRVDDQPRIRRWACGLSAVGILCYPLGSVIDYYYALRGEDPFPSAADFFYVATYVFQLPGVLLVATRGTSTVARGRLLLDTALTVVALGTFSWYFLLGPILLEGADTLLETVLSASYCVFDLAILFAAMFVSGRIAGGHARRVTVPLVLGVLAQVGADTLWGYRTLMGTYEMGDITDAGWPVGYLLIGLAIRAHLLAPFVSAQEDQAHSATGTSVTLWRAVLPYTLLPMVAVLLAYDHGHQSVPWIQNGIYGGSLILLILLLVRQLLSIYENVGLNRQLQHTLGELKASHQSLAGANAKMRAINRATIDGVMVLNPDWRIEEFNAAAGQMFGYPDGLAEGRALKELFHFPSGEDALIGKRTEVVGRRADGSTLPVELAVVAVELDGPSIFVAFARDLTEQKEAERVREDLHQRLISASRQAGMAEVATGVLHNVGNVLNSVNVSASLVTQKLRKSEVASLKRAADLISEHKGDLATYISTDRRGQQLPDFLVALTRTLADEQTTLLGEAANLERSIEHLKHIINSQQSHAKSGILLQAVAPESLIDSALKMHVSSFANHDIEVIREIESIPTLLVDQHKVLQILVNLISNAKHALKQSATARKQIRVVMKLKRVDSTERLQLQVIDNGIGIAPDMLSKIFAHGFTTRQDGHGFGLHSAANLAQQMGGSLIGQSEGPGTGATFTLELPVTHPKPTSTVAKEI